jgi:protein-tyrosine kinase
MAISTRASQREQLAIATSQASGLLITDPGVPQTVEQAYRQTYLNVRFALLGAPGNTLLVSAMDATAPSAALAANLAILAAREGERVVLVDANPHAKALGTLFNLTTGLGFASLIRQEGASLTDALQRFDSEPSLCVMSGEGDPVPGGLGRAPGLNEVLLRLKNSADRLILLGAPILTHVDSLDLCPLVDGVLVSMRPGRTHREDAATAEKILARVHAPLLGVVLSQHGT